ncbi:MAG: transcriptional repressor [Dehalococcoidia bacterium]|nr:transcriptional repressor [Dehalococcoidia bacterium]
MRATVSPPRHGGSPGPHERGAIDNACACDMIGGMVSTIAMERNLERMGRRLTGPRRELLAVITSLGGHFSAEQLAAAAPGVGRATVFRTLRLLQDAGAVCQVVALGGALEYRVTAVGHHHHLVCAECGAVEDFSGCDISDLLAELANRTGYDISAHRLEVYGRCAVCQGRLSAPQEAKRRAGGASG